MAKKQDWSPRAIPRMHIEILLDMEGQMGNPPFNLRKVKELLGRLVRSPEFNELLTSRLEEGGQGAVVADGEVGANYFTIE